MRGCCGRARGAVEVREVLQRCKWCWKGNFSFHRREGGAVEVQGVLQRRGDVVEVCGIVQWR